MCFFTCLSSSLTFWRPTCPCLSNHLQTGHHAADSSAAQPNNKSSLAILVRCGRALSAPLQAARPGSDYKNTQTRPTHKRGGCDENIRRQNMSRPHQPGHRCSAVFFLSCLYVHPLISFLVLCRQLSPRNIPSSTRAWRKSNSPRPAQIPPAPPPSCFIFLISSFRQPFTYQLHFGHGACTFRDDSKSMCRNWF